MSRRFDGILFDAGGIFVIPDPTASALAAAPFGAATDPARFVRAHYAGMEALDREASTRPDPSIDRISWDHYRRAYLDSAGVRTDSLDDAVAVLRRLFSPYYWRFPLLESVAALGQLHVRGVPIGIVSNASGQIEATLANLCICQVGPGAGVPVRIVTDSHVIGYAKPDPRIFADAISALDVEPSRIAYVGDSFVNDVGGARNAGVVPILYDPFDDHAGYDCERVASLHELLEWVTA